MGFGSIWHWLLVILVLVLLFGAGKISGLMGDLAKGIKSFKKEMAEGDGEPAPAPEPEPRRPESDRAQGETRRQGEDRAPRQDAADAEGGLAPFALALSGSRAVKTMRHFRRN